MPKKKQAKKRWKVHFQQNPNHRIYVKPSAWGGWLNCDPYIQTFHIDAEGERDTPRKAIESMHQFKERGYDQEWIVDNKDEAQAIFRMKSNDETPDPYMVVTVTKLYEHKKEECEICYRPGHMVASCPKCEHDFIHCSQCSRQTEGTAS